MYQLQVFGLAWLPLQMQVRWDDQSQYPEVTIESFVGQSSMGLFCPPCSSDLHERNESW